MKNSSPRLYSSEIKDNNIVQNNFQLFREPMISAQLIKYKTVLLYSAYKAYFR
jgi:hypothetical protein